MPGDVVIEIVNELIGGAALNGEPLKPIGSSLKARKL